jgi:tetratricopeptide (TPR) repeat protein
VLDLLGAALAEAGRLDEAITAFSRQLEVYVELGDRYGEGEARGNLGAVLGEAGRFEEAIDVLTRAVDIFRGLGDRRNEGRSLGMLGAALAEVGRFDEARECWERATSMLAELGDAAWIEVIREFAGELLPAAESGEPQGTPSQPRPAE